MAAVSIVVPVFNQVHLTRRCLASLFDGATKPHELIVVDNNSTDDTPEYLKSASVEGRKRGWTIQTITNSKNKGVSAAFNLGIKASRSDYVILLNNDTWLMPGWDNAILEVAQKINGDMVGAYYYEGPFDEIQTPKLAKRFTSRNKGKYSDDWAAIMMCYKRSTFEKIGLFDERFFIGFEDVDIRERMVRAGLKYYKVADCFIWHHSKGTRDSKHVRPGYEQESLKKFIEKWGFDPRPRENTRILKMKRKWNRFKNSLGLF